MNAPTPLAHCAVQKSGLVMHYTVTMADGPPLIEGTVRDLAMAEKLMACAGALYVIECGVHPAACAVQFEGLGLYGDDASDVGRFLLTAFHDGTRRAVLPGED